MKTKSGIMAGLGETFDEVVEERLKREGGRPATEILNFAVGSYSLLQQLLLLEDRVWSFSPDVIIVVGHPGDAERLAIQLVQQVRRGVLPPFDPVRQVLARAQVTPEVRETEAMSRLMPFREELVSWALRRLVEVSRERNVRPVWVYLSIPDRAPAADVVQRMVAQARDAGFHVLDWSDVYDGVEPSALQASPWDFHPNASGHARIAERFYRELARDTVFGAPRSSGVPAAPVSKEKQQ